MAFDEIAKLSERLNYRDKLRLAQLLIQLARKEEEEHSPATRAESGAAHSPVDPELVQYVADRLRKLRPAKKDAVLNSIGAMFQFRGGVSDSDKEKIFAELLRARYISITEQNRVVYSDKK